MPPATPVTQQKPPATLKSAPVVTARHILWAGIVIGIFHPPVVGLVYSAFFLFHRPTRRVAVYVALWTIFWALLYSFAIGFIVAWMQYSYVAP